MEEGGFDSQRPTGYSAGLAKPALLSGHSFLCG